IVLRKDFNRRGWNVAFVLCNHARNRFDGDHCARSLICDWSRTALGFVQHSQARALVKISNNNPERQTPVIDHSILFQDRFWNSGDLIEIVVGGVDHRQLYMQLILGIIFGVTAFQAHVTLNCEKIGKQAASQHDDKSGVSEMDPELAPRPAKPFRVCRDQIDQQNGADEMTAGKNWNSKTISFRRPPNQPALEVTLLRFMNAK